MGYKHDTPDTARGYGITREARVTTRRANARTRIRRVPSHIVSQMVVSDPSTVFGADA